MLIQRFHSLLLKRPQLHALPLAALAALFLLLADNQALWHALRQALTTANPARATTSMLTIMAVSYLLFTAVCYLLLWPKIGKLLLAAVFIMAGFAGYSIDAYGTHIDANMVENLVETNWREMSDLFSWQFVVYTLWHSVLPCVLLALVRVIYGKPLHLIWHRVSVLALALIFAAPLVWADYDQLSALGRNHRDVRFLINPWLPMYYTYAYFNGLQTPTNVPFQTLGQDAVLRHTDVQPTLLVLVVGETARSQNFSLNGYERDTNPELAQLNVVSFQNVSSCGTETAVSVPCMFSPLPRADYDKKIALSSSNLLDILQHAGVAVSWHDNNSGSKGMAKRVDFKDVSRANLASDCPPNSDHCYDSILLHGLDAWLAKQQGSTLLVLHMYGSHGPAYYQRYPEQFARFLPECRTNALSKCPSTAIVNSYDNTILYTDHVLAQLIAWLKQQSHFNTAMLYLSDHGESLGEKGIYLHGMPRRFAPEEQTHIPFIWWQSHDFSKARGVSLACLKQGVDRPLSQDNLFSSVLGIFHVKTHLYDPSLDFLADCYRAL